jgi:hypothetical protein
MDQPKAHIQLKAIQAVTEEKFRALPDIPFTITL